MQAIAIRIAIMVAAILLAAIFFLATGAFLCVALYEGLQMLSLTPPLAALASAAIFLLVALLIIFIGSAIARSAERRAKLERERRGPATAQLGLDLGRMLAEEATRYAGKHPIPVLVGSVLAGFALAALPRFRSLLGVFFKHK